MSAQRTLLTAEQLLEESARLSAKGKRCELVKGELEIMAPAGGRHGRVANNAAFILTRYVREKAQGTVFAAETGFLIGRDPDTIRAPDVAFVSRARLSEEEPTGYLELAPDLAVEVVSPHDTASYVQAKVEDWLGAGVRLVWVLYPERRSIVVYRSLKDVQVLSEPDSLDGRPVFDDFSVSVSELFR